MVTVKTPKRAPIKGVGYNRLLEQLVNIPEKVKNYFLP